MYLRDLEIPKKKSFNKFESWIPNVLKINSFAVFSEDFKIE